MATGTVVSTGDIITAAKMNLKQETGVDLANLSVNDLGTDQLAIVVNENLTADRTLNIIVNDAERTINLGGNITTAGAFVTSGAFSLTLTATALTDVTLPTTGTLTTLAGSENLTNKTLTASVLSGTFTGTPTLSGATITFTGGTIALTGGAAYTLRTTDAFALNLGASGANRLAITATIGTFTVFQTTANYTLAFSDPAAGRTITFPDPLGDDSVTYIAAVQSLSNKTLTAPALSGTVTGTPTFSGNLTFTGTLTVNGTNIDTIVQDTSPHIDVGLDIFSSGTVLDIRYDTAEVLTAALTGIFMDLGTNVTTGGAGTGNIQGLHIDLGPLTFDGAYNGTVRGIFVEADPTLTDEAIEGIRVNMSGTFGSGAEIGVVVTGDGQTIQIGNDTDLYMSLAKASSVDVNFQGISPVIDIGVDVLENGVIVDVDYDSAETLSGTSLTGIDINFNTNVTNTEDTDVYGYRFQTAALTQSGAVTTNFRGLDVPTAGALVQDTAAGTLDWRGVNIQLPNTTQTTGAVRAYGVYVTAGTLTSGTMAALIADGNVDTVLNLSSSPVLDIGADVFESGTFIDIAYDTAETLTGALIGINVNLNTNVTLSGQNVNGIIVAMPATYGAGAEVGIQVTGDGQTINIGNDADLYVSLAKASSVDINIQGISPVVDIGADVLESGTIIDFQYDTAETLATAALVGVSMNLNTNLTYVGGQNVTGYTVQTAAFTNAAAAATVVTGFQLPTAGALVNQNAGGSITWYGVDLQMPNITQTAGTMTATGIRIIEGTTTSGTAVGLSIDVDIAIDLVTLGNRIDLDADNDTSIRASADDVITIEVLGADLIDIRTRATSSAVVQAASGTEIGFCVTNGTLAVGSAGSVVIPTNAGVGSDGVFGDLDGAIGFDLTNNTIEVRDTVWLSSAALTGYGIQTFVPWVWDKSGFYHPRQMLGVQIENGQGILEEYVDETICFICGERMEPGDQSASRAITLYPNAWLRKGVERREMLHNIFGHAHPEREPYIASLSDRMAAVEEAERILADSLDRRVGRLEKQVREMGAVPVA